MLFCMLQTASRKFQAKADTNMHTKIIWHRCTKEGLTLAWGPASRWTAASRRGSAHPGRPVHTLLGVRAGANCPSGLCCPQRHSLEDCSLAPGNHLQKRTLVRPLSTKGIVAATTQINIGSSCMQTKQCLRSYSAV